MRSCYKSGMKMLPNAPENRTGPDYCSLAPSVGVYKGGLVYSPWGYPWEFLVGVCRPVHKIQTRSQTKKCHFPPRFQTRPLKSITVFRPGLQTEIMLSLLRLERKPKKCLNPFRIRMFLFLSYSFGIETINTFIPSVVPSKTIPVSRPKWAKCIPVCRPKRRKNPTMGRHIPIQLI